MHNQFNYRGKREPKACAFIYGNGSQGSMNSAEFIHQLAPTLLIAIVGS